MAGGRAVFRRRNHSLKVKWRELLSELSYWLLHWPAEGDLGLEVAHDRDETSGGPGSGPPCSDGMCAAAAGAWRANEGDDAAPRGARAGERDVRMRASSCAPCAPCPRRHSPSPAERSPPGRARSRRMPRRARAGRRCAGCFDVRGCVRTDSRGVVRDMLHIEGPENPGQARGCILCPQGRWGLKPGGVDTVWMPHELAMYRKSRVYLQFERAQNPWQTGESCD